LHVGTVAVNPINDGLHRFSLVERILFFTISLAASLIGGVHLVMLDLIVSVLLRAEEELELAATLVTLLTREIEREMELR
jgi:hypothetical protein